MQKLSKPVEIEFRKILKKYPKKESEISAAFEQAEKKLKEIKKILEDLEKSTKN